MRFRYQLALVILAVGLTCYGPAPASADLDGKNYGQYAGWLTACGSLVKSGSQARRAWKKWSDEIGLDYFGKVGAKTFMTYYDLAVSSHASADNNHQICGDAESNVKAQELFNLWLGVGLKLDQDDD